MDTDSWLGLGILLTCLAIVGFANSAESGLAAITRIRRGQNGTSSPGAKTLEWVMGRRRTLQVTLLVMKTSGVVFASIILVWLLSLGQRIAVGSILAIGLAAVFLLIFIQAISYALADQVPNRAWRVVLAPLRVADIALTPITALYSWLAHLATRIGRRVEAQARPREDEEEVEAIVEEIEDEAGILEKAEREMIRGIIHMETTTVRDIMVPRLDIVAADADASPASVVDLVVKHGFSRVPIYEEIIDKIAGVVYAKDLLKALQVQGEPPSLQSLTRKAHFVPESKKTAELLKEFRQERVHMAIVVDEYGGTAGLVSLEDLLEEIVGEIEDEYDREEKPIEQVGKHEAVIDARVSIDDLNELFSTEIAPQDFATVGGLVYAQLGKIPNVGDVVHVDDLTISVLSTVGRRIKKIRAVHHQTEEHSSGQN